MPVVDAHAHLDHAFGGGWIDRPPGELLAVLDEAGVDRLVDLSGGWGVEVLHRHLDHFKAAAPERFAMLGGVDWARWPTEGDEFVAGAARSLEQQFDRGAAGLKVWKTLGLEATDDRGTLAAIDDERLDPIWAVCADRRLPVVIHVGDPIEFFQPKGADNPRSAELERHPEWHWHQRVDRTHQELHRQFDELLGRRPDVRFVGAHLLDLTHSPTALGDLLARRTNLSVDLGARFGHLSDAPPELAALFAWHPDRLLYGLDHPPEARLYDDTIEITHRVLNAGLRAAGQLADTDESSAKILGGNAAALFWP